MIIYKIINPEFKLDIKYPVSNFYEWHNKLTGSCEFGRQNFMKNKGLNMDDYITVDDFINLTIGEYGGKIIQNLAKKIK